ncbi:MAG: type II secretion system F family protein [Planctomycetes bacterium]|nr:type II secretion system F family protein [Planctomycetota bacterium]
MSSGTFSYRAVDEAGNTRRGVSHARTRVEAYRRITATGLTPVKISRSTGPRRLKSKGVKARDVTHFTHQLSVLIAARIPVSEGLRTIGDQEPSAALRRMVLDVATRIEAGEPIADALSAHQTVFGEVYIETIRAAEQSGTLGAVLEYLSEMLERSQDLAHQIRSALAYPFCVVAVLMGAVTFLLGFVVPRFGHMYERRGVELPMLTKMMVLLGDSIQTFWWLYLLGFGIGVLTLRKTWRSSAGRTMIERALHKVPYLSDLLVAVAIARFSRILGLCISAGVNLIDSIELAGRSSGREMLRSDSDRIIRGIQSGSRLGELLEQCAYLTPFVRRMLAAGENSGELPRMCSIVARHYERETTTMTKYLTTVLEPVLIVLVAAVVLVVALSVFLPMWDMVTLLG